MSHKTKLYSIILIALLAPGHLASARVLKSGPYIHFERRGQVTVYWQSNHALPSVLEYATHPGKGTFLRDKVPKTDHALGLSVKPDATYFCRIHVGKTATDRFQFHSAFDYGSAPVPKGLTPYAEDQWTPIYEEAADFIVSQFGQSRGICVDYGCGLGRLAFEIARRSHLKVIGFEENPEKVALARKTLDAAGLYGTHVVVHQADLSHLPCRDYLANLVVSDDLLRTGTLPGIWTEALRVMRPAGGTAIVGGPSSDSASSVRASIQPLTEKPDYRIDPSHARWTTVRREALAGAGCWDHFYANPANTANSGETRLTNRMQLLWYGTPGPRFMTDRHNRAMTSLYKNGIVITPGLDRLMAYDAYNGVRYWDMVIPDSTRVSVQRDSAWMCLAEDRVYTVHNNHCVALDLKSGIPQRHFEIPRASRMLNERWGYVATQGDRLYGSSQDASASIIGQTRPKIMAYSYGDNLPIAVSQTLFCLDRHNGRTLWIYGANGKQRIVNSSITLSGNAVVFIERTDPEAALPAQSRLAASTLLVSPHTYLVKLDTQTGIELWRRPVTLPFRHMLYLQIAQNQQMIIASGARNQDKKIHYDVLAFNLNDGKEEWSCVFNTGVDSGASHGEQEQHPVIASDTLYTKFFSINLRKGIPKTFSLSHPNGGGCGTLSACATHLFGRAGNPFMYGQVGTQAIRLTHETRPGCWINTYPAGGLVMIPESSSGCSCDFPVQASLAFQPID